MYSSTVSLTSALYGGGWTTPCPGRFTPEKDQVPIVQGAGWVPRPLWTRAENLTFTGIRSSDRPARSESLNDCAILPEHYNETVEFRPQREMSKIFQTLHAYVPPHCTTRHDSGRFGPCVAPFQRPCMVLYSDCGCFKCYLFHCTTAWRPIYFVCIYITLRVLNISMFGSAIYVTLFLFLILNYKTLLTFHCVILHPRSFPQAIRKL
jgi:hypothetical protein